MTTIINLYGGPGCGKSTSAAYIYYKLKTAGHNVEMVREYVKEWAWDKRYIGQFDQLYFLGKQSRKESMLYDKVQFIVTDCPVLMGTVYARRQTGECLAEGIERATYGYYELASLSGHSHHHIMLKRTVPYTEAGRWQTEVDAQDIDKAIAGALAKAQVSTAFKYEHYFVDSGVTTTELDLTLAAIL